MAKDTRRHPLELPEALHQQLKELAERDRRPLNNYLVIVLEKHAEAEKSNA